MRHYARFVALWERADLELGPSLQDVRERMGRLQRR